MNNTQNRAKQLLNARRSHYVNRDGISEQKHLKARIRALKRKLGYVEISEIWIPGRKWRKLLKI